MDSAWPGSEALLSFCGLLLRCFAWLLESGGGRPGGKESRAGPGAVAPGADLLGLASH